MLIAKISNNKKIVIDISEDLKLRGVNEKDGIWIIINSLTIDGEPINVTRDNGMKLYGYVKGVNKGKAYKGFEFRGEAASKIGKIVINDSKMDRMTLTIEDERFDKMIEEFIARKEIEHQEQIDLWNEEIRNLKDDEIVYIEIHSSYGASISIENHDNIEKKYCDLNEMENKINKAEKIDYRKTMDFINPYLTGGDYGDYSSWSYYKMTVAEFKELLNLADNITAEKVRKDEEKEARRIEHRNELIRIAKETGEKQLTGQWSEPCNDRNEECNVDICYQYIDGDGNYSIERQHTW